MTDALGSYRYESSKGAVPSDRTAFHKAHECWETNDPPSAKKQSLESWKASGNAIPGHRPRILFQFQPCDDWRKGGGPAGFLKQGTSTVLDWTGKPIKDYKDVPLSISCEVEPERIEAIRRSDVNISRHDILARVNTRKEGTHLEENALNMKLLRWRLENNCIAWGKNSSSKAIEAYIYSTLFPEQIAKNTTEGGNPVRKSLGQVDYMRAINWGVAPKKAKKKTMTQEKAEKKLKDRYIHFEKAAEWADRGWSVKYPFSMTFHQKSQS